MTLMLSGDEREAQEYKYGLPADIRALIIFTMWWKTGKQNMVKSLHGHGGVWSIRKLYIYSYKRVLVNFIRRKFLTRGYDLLPKLQLNSILSAPLMNAREVECSK